MTCDHFKRAMFASTAAGQELGGDLENHYRQCADCWAALKREENLWGQINAALRRRLDEEPTPGFFARVRAGIPEEGLPQTGWNPTWLFAAASLSLVLIFAAHLRTGSHARTDEAANLPGRTLAVQQLSDPNPIPSAIVNSAIPTRHSRQIKGAPASRRNAGGEPEVLVPAVEAKAFQQFVTRLADRHEVVEALVNGPLNEEDELDPICPVEIADLWLQPLVWERWK